MDINKKEMAMIERGQTPKRWVRLANEYSKVQEEANQLVGRANDNKKLAWLFNFLETDLAKVSKDKRNLLGACLLQMPINYQTALDDLFMSETELRECQQVLKENLAALFDDTKRGWRIAPPREFGLWRMSPLSSPGAHFQFFMRGNPREGILYGVMDLLRRTPGRVRGCGYCNKPILRSKRQEYCNEECSRARREENRRGAREKSRLVSLLKKHNVITELPGADLGQKQKHAETLREKLNSISTSRESLREKFWKDLDDGSTSVLKQRLAMKGRKR